MKIHTLETGNYKLDGGAIFGIIPKSLWNNVYPSDEKNLCNFSMRCLLIETADRLVLIDTGLGNKQSEKFFSYYYLNGSDSLQNSLTKKGFLKSSVTDVILTHLHFDHCGGAVERDEGDKLVPAFPNAKYWVSRPQWEWATRPNQQEKASFLIENFEVLERSGQLNFIETEGIFSEDINIRFFNGHSEGLMVPFITYKNRILVYTNDMLPTTAHIPASWVCGFDTKPLVSMQERESFMQEAVMNNYVLFFEHDIYNECCTLKQTEKGPRMDRSFTLKKFLDSNP